MISEQLGNRGCRQPIDSRGRISPAQFVQNRDAVNHIAYGGQLDQQDLAEFLEGKLAKARGQPSSHEVENFL